MMEEGVGSRVHAPAACTVAPVGLEGLVVNLLVIQTRPSVYKVTPPGHLEIHHLNTPAQHASLKF